MLLSSVQSREAEVRGDVMSERVKQMLAFIYRPFPFETYSQASEKESKYESTVDARGTTHPTTADTA